MKKTTIHLISTAMLLFGILYAGSEAYALNAPHDSTSSLTVACKNCHPARGTSPAWTIAPVLNDITKNNNRCFQCHDTPTLGLKFGKVQTHSHFQSRGTMTSPDYPSGFLMECRVCHDPHFQMQNEAYPSEGNIFTGIVLSATTSTLMVSSPTLSTSLQNYLLIPNVLYPNYVYRIVGNTQTAITVQKGATVGMATQYITAGGTFAVKYGKMVKSQITKPGSAARPVKFFNESGPGSFATSSVTVNGVCQVCHTSTKYFKNDGTLEVGTASTHPTPAGVNCVSCHSHSEGFKAGGCNACHGQSGPTGAPLIAGDLASPATGHTVGAHPKHVSSLNITCATCHFGDGMPTVDSTITVAFSGIGAGGAYQGKTLSAPYVYSAGVPTGATESCSTLYCHSSGQSADGATALPVYAASNPDWEVPASGACGTCHATTAPNYATGGHTTHLAADTNCGNCHTGASASAYVSASHVNQSIDVANGYTAGGAPGNGYGTCSTAACHASPYALTTVVTPAWGVISGCAACHTGANVITATGPATGSHAKHSTAACTACHNAGTSATTAPLTSHPDNNITVTSGYPAVVAKHAAGTYTGNCTTTCHSPTLSSVATPTWGQTATCSSCHALTPATGSHTKHLSGLGGMYIANAVCGTCHTGYVQGTTAAVNHLNTTIEVNVGGYPSPKAKGSAFSSCSTAYCHSNGPDKAQFLPATWGDTSTGCNYCHGFPPVTAIHAGQTATTCVSCHDHVNSAGTGFATPSLHGNNLIEAAGTCNSCHDYDTVNGDWGTSPKAIEGWGAHAKHIDHLKVRAGIATLDPVADNYTSAKFIAVCGSCHTRTEANHTMNNSSGRMINFGDNAVTYRLNNTTPAVYSGTSGSSSADAAKTCSNISCHFQATPVWQGY